MDGEMEAGGLTSGTESDTEPGEVPDMGSDKAKDGRRSRRASPRASERRKDLPERLYNGLAVSPGVGIGLAYVRESGVIAIPEYKIPTEKLALEGERLNRAVTTSRDQISELRARSARLGGAAGEEIGYLLQAYDRMLADSRLVRGVRQRINDESINAEAAVQAEVAEIARSFETMEDAYIAARLDDIRGVANRLLRNLVGDTPPALDGLPEGSVIIAEDLTPADTAQLDPNRCAGIATALGGAEGHTAIMARALGIPAVLGAPGLLQGLRPGEVVVVDGDQGLVIINPHEDRLTEARERRAQALRESRRLGRLKKKPAVTRDGVEISLAANVELPVQMAGLEPAGAEGVGLLRTEFQFMNRDDLPDANEQYAQLAEIVKAAEGRPVTIRTLDMGGDKQARALDERIGASGYSPLGVRGIRLSLRNADLFEDQMTAILRAGALGPVRVLLPMVATPAEVRQARDVMERVAKRLARRKVKIADPLPPLGIMIEVPGAALSADALSREADFFAIGSNDLTMYTLAIDRADEAVANLYDPLHPAVLRLIQFSGEAALRARIPVSICGEIAGDPRFTALLLGLGFRELSMATSSIPRVKERIRSLDLSQAEGRARMIMDQVDSRRIGALIDDFNT
ncbi:MAG: phosphoenolpyruvate--protein phosphotransferase [Magnetovibrionaceae bacterium]